MFTDQPVEHIKDDQLRRQYLAEEIGRDLVQSLQSTTESFVVGINGPWGSGKSTLVNFIIEVIERISKDDNREIVVLRFNPWMFTGQKELQTIFFKELFLKLKKRKGVLHKAGQVLGSLLDHMAWLSETNPKTKLISSGLKLFSSWVTKEKDLADLKKELDAIFIKGKVKLYITIDDIERLTPEEVADIFQLVKLNGNFANTIFLLAYDEKVIVDSLKKRFGENAKKYLEKIIQADYTMPGVDRAEIPKILNARVRATFANDPELIALIDHTFKDFSTSEFAGLLDTMRDVIRFVNALKLRLPAIAQELNIEDFFVVESLRLLRPEAYRFILDNKETLTQRHSFEERHVFSRSETDLVTAADNLILNTAFDSLTKELLYTMFKHSNVLHRLNQDEAFTDRRLSDKNYFERYFSLQLTPRDFPEEYFEVFLALEPDADEMMEVLEAVAEMDRLNSFFSFMAIRANYDLPDCNTIVEVILRFSLTVHFEKPRNSTKGPLEAILEHASTFIKWVPTLRERRQIVTDFIAQPVETAAFSNYFICEFILGAKVMVDSGSWGTDKIWYYLFDDNKESNDAFAIQIKAQKQIALERLFERVVSTPDVLNDREMHTMLKVLKPLDRAAYSARVLKLVRDDNVLLRLLYISLSRNSKSDNGETGYRFNGNDVLAGVAPDYLLERFNSMDFDGLPRIYQQIITIFKKCHSEGFPFKKYFSLDTLEELVDVDG